MTRQNEAMKARDKKQCEKCRFRTGGSRVKRIEADDEVRECLYFLSELQLFLYQRSSCWGAFLFCLL